MSLTMICDYCATHVPLLSRRHRLRRLLIPRCPHCNSAKFSLAHKLAVLMLFALALYSVMRLRS